MPSLNKVMLIGRLGKDPELKYSAANGAPVANFTMATDESYKDKDGAKVERTEWHRVVVFSRQAETVSNYLSKGRLVYVEGNIRTRQWKDQQDQTRYTTEIVAQRIQFLESLGQSHDMEQSPEDMQAQPPYYSGSKGKGQSRDKADDDMGPAFPSEASGMDEVPF